MTVSRQEIEAFTLRYHLAILEGLVLKQALLAPTLFGQSLVESRNDLKDWLDRQASIADAVYGDHFRDPAEMALYADEVKAIVEEMKKRVDKIVREVQANLKRS